MRRILLIILGIILLAGCANPPMRIWSYQGRNVHIIWWPDTYSETWWHIGRE